MSLNNKKGYIHWGIDKFIDMVGKFVKNDLELPVALQDHENVVKMLTLLFPCSVRHPIPNLMSKVDRVLFTSAFRENNNKMRYKFFSDPLIKHLWSKIFIKDNPEIIVAHLRRVRSQGDRNLGLARQERFLLDMGLLESELNFKTIPDAA